MQRPWKPSVVQTLIVVGTTDIARGLLGLLAQSRPLSSWDTFLMGVTICLMAGGIMGVRAGWRWVHDRRLLRRGVCEGR